MSLYAIELSPSYMLLSMDRVSREMRLKKRLDIGPGTYKKVKR